jgi:hypothetical protein
MQYVAHTAPEVAARLIRAHFEYHLDSYQIPEPNFVGNYDMSPYHARENLFKQFGEDALSQPLEHLAKEHPRLFLECLLPCLERLLLLSGEPWT